MAEEVAESDHKSRWWMCPIDAL